MTKRLLLISWTALFFSTGCHLLVDVPPRPGDSDQCGNDQLDVGETCDGEHFLPDVSCESLGYASGTLACTLDCIPDTTGCDLPEDCGNGAVDVGEDCDGSNLDDQTCELQGFASGTLACAANCKFDTTGCDVPENCGNGGVDTGEDCDGEDLDGFECVDVTGVPGGTLACAEDCTFDTSLCGPSSNADLATLTVSEASLVPVFSPTTMTYSVTLPLAVTSQTISATAADAPLATILIEPAQPMTLTVGNNPATVTVTAEDGTQKVYTVNVIRYDVDNTSPYIGLLVFVPAGTFQRDSTPTNLSQVSAFRMSMFEITRTQWTAVTGWADPSDVIYSSGVNDPVQMVNWYDAIAFCNKLSLLEGLTPVYAVSGVNFSTLTYAQIPASDNATWNAATANWAENGYRLPTEMEWMWAAMGADTANPGATNTMGYAKAFAGSTGTNAIGDYAWYDNNSQANTHPSESKLPNELGLYHLSGNVNEWAWDWNLTYPTGTVTDYRGPASGTSRAVRGGAWISTASDCTVANRNFYGPHNRNNRYGFRVVRR